MISYGKEAVSLYRTDGVSTLFAAEVALEVFGDNFLPAYTEGDNSLVYATLAGELDFALTDTAQLTYPRRLVAVRNSLLVTARGAAPVRVQGFTNSRLRVVDVTKPDAPIELKPLVKKVG